MKLRPPVPTSYREYGITMAYLALGSLAAEADHRQWLIVAVLALLFIINITLAVIAND